MGELRYKPYGETRYVWGTTPTDRRFTGQLEESGLGSLYDYGARRYSPLLGRFLSADTIVPSPGNPQDLNRFSYVRNNPLKYTDPSGHDCVYVNGHLECSQAGAVIGGNTLTVDMNPVDVQTVSPTAPEPTAYYASPDYVPPPAQVPQFGPPLPPPPPMCYAPPPGPPPGPSETEVKLWNLYFGVTDLLVAGGGYFVSATDPSYSTQAMAARMAPNSKFADQVFHPTDPKIKAKYPSGVKFTKDGHPDFSPYALYQVKIKMKGNYTTDFTDADKAAGLTTRPKGYTWHHHQDRTTMLLVPTDLHRAVSHSGGVSLLK